MIIDELIIDIKPSNKWQGKINFRTIFERIFENMKDSLYVDFIYFWTLAGDVLYILNLYS